MKNLFAQYKKRKSQIKQRLMDFSRIHKGEDEDIFSELAFCILTPQSSAVNCDKAIKELKKKDLILKGTVAQIAKRLRGLARFHNNKAGYIVEARNKFKTAKGLCLKEKIDLKDILNTREWLVKNIKGLGYKEASHFLRNIGLGKDLAILDVHILKNLKRYNAITEIPKSLTKNKYLEIEEKTRRFARKANIPLADLDLLFWSRQTGFIFK